MHRPAFTLVSFNACMALLLTGCAGFGGPAGGGIPICLNEPFRCPDLVPAIVTDQEDLDADRACIFCRELEVDGRRALEVSVNNRGGIGFYKETTPPGGIPIGNPDARPSVTRVVFTAAGGETTVVDLPTPELAVGFSVDLEPVIFPTQCSSQDCNVTITVDADEEVTESAEGNNRVSCFFPIVL